MKFASKLGLTLLVIIAGLLAGFYFTQNSDDIATAKVDLKDGNSLENEHIENEHVEPAGTDIASRKVELKDGNSIEYRYIEPAGFEASKEYPILLAFPPGAQDRKMVDVSFDLYWGAGGKHGWVVVAPVAPNDTYFTMGSEVLIPEFLEKLRARYKPVGGKFHLAGISNGGTSVFRVAGLFPDEFHSLIAMPGYPKSDQDKKNLAKLKTKTIALYAGASDTKWVDRMESTAETLKELGANVSFEIIEGQGHVIQGWQDGKKLFTQLNQWNEQLKK